MIRRKKRERKEKPEPERHVIVEREDVRILKYPAACNPFGFTPEHAAKLAEPVPNQRAYDVIPVAVFKFARAQGRPMTTREAMREYDARPKDEGVEDAG